MIEPDMGARRKFLSKDFFIVGTFLVLIGIAFSVFLVVRGMAGGWVLMGLLVVIWLAGAYSRKAVNSTYR
ncbi:hypothetical protein ACIQI8_43880 [Streptomyces sp. NPDC092369]|uniref:hypothetical protein n=1 Tax=Streptomyces sp. NPDC092369 TaxID=3366015 RepID=UPI003822D613